MERPEYKSPRKVEEEIREYTHKRFEAYMMMVDDGTLTRAIALTAFQDEVDYYFWNNGEAA
jgi:hypothetical protein